MSKGILKTPSFFSIGEALSLKQLLSHKNIMPSTTTRVYQAGIVVGSPHLTMLSDRQVANIKYCLATFNPLDELPQPFSKVVRTYSRVVKMNDYDLGVTYRKGDTVIVSDYEQPQEWVMQVTEFLVYGPIFDQYYHFIDGEYFVPKLVSGNLDIDSWTQQQWMMKRNFERLRVQPINQLQRKVMLYPHSWLQNHFLTIDPIGPIVTYRFLTI